MNGGTAAPSRPPDAVFAKIAARYDRLNRILSLGRDQAWRRAVTERLPAGDLLDLGSGTGAALPLFGDRFATALDPVPEMLERNPSPRRVRGMGERLPFADGSFDAVFSAFTVRNLDSVPETLAETARVLRPGGAAGFVDLGRPPGRTAAALHRAGTAVLLPLAGATIGAGREYRYLHRSLDGLPPPEELYAGGPLRMSELWRMGPLGFVYGVILTRP